MGSITIRQMKTGEAADVSRIYARSWKEAYKGIVPQDYLDGLSELRWAGRLTGDPERRSLVLLEGGQYVGTSSISPARDEKMAGWGEVISLYLLPEYWGRGYGAALLRYDITRLKKTGFQDVYLWALEKNARARAFYEKFGFTRDGGETLCEIGGARLTEVQYVFRTGVGKDGG